MPKRLEETEIRPNPDFTRFRKVLTGEGKPDRVPFYELFANVETMEAILGKPIPDRVATIEFYYRTGYDYVPTFPRAGFILGSLVDRSKGYPITDWETFESYPWPTVESISYKEFELVKAALPEGMLMVGQTGGVFECAESLVGYEQLCFLLQDEPSLVSALFDRIGRIYRSMYQTMAGISEVGALVISDDLGFKTQTMISPDYLRQYVLPIHKDLSEIAHSAGKPCILHSCGQLGSILKDIIEIVRIDAKHSYEDSILPVTEAMKLYGDRMGVLGGFDLDRLCRSTEDEVREYTRMLITELGSTGRYALGSGNSIPGYVPVENYLAMLDTGWREGVL